MNRFRPLAFAATAALMLGVTPGCRTAGVGSLTREPNLFPNRTSEDAVELLSEHNRNAELVETLRARPSITVNNRRSPAVKVNGWLALERPRNFKLELTAVAGMTDVANIGSNDQEFWFWVKDSPDKAVYYCDYENLDNSPLAASLQPDWITEAFGLKIVTEQEAARIRVTPGSEPGTLVLTQTEKAPRGDSLLKETILSESTHRILEHRIMTSDRKTVLARARITDYTDHAVPRRAGGEDSTPRRVYLPKTVRLEWAVEKLVLDVSLTGVQINPPLSDSDRAELFVEPKFKGFARKNLAEGSTYASQTAPTSVRETLPAPAPRVKLSAPADATPEGARRAPTDPVSVLANLPSSQPVEVENIIGPMIPTVSEPSPELLNVRPGWRNTVER